MKPEDKFSPGVRFGVNTGHDAVAVSITESTFISGSLQITGGALAP